MQFKGPLEEAWDSEIGKLRAAHANSFRAHSRPDNESSPKVSLFAAVSYGIVSMAMVFINKAVLLQYPHSMTLLVLEQFATATLIHIGKVFGLTNARSLEIRTAKRLFPLSIFYNANVAFTLASLKGVNILMFIALKRLTPLAVLIAGYFFGKAKPSLQVALSVFLTGLGVIVAALGNFSFNPAGYILALISVAFQTAYLVLVERSATEDGVSSIELMHYNSVLSLPFLCFLIFGTKEMPHAGVLLLQKVMSVNFTILLVISLLMGIILNYTMFLCTLVNSALTTTIVGVLKGVGTTTLGFILLGGVRVHALNMAGLVINSAGGIWYSFAKYKEKLKRKGDKHNGEQQAVLKWTS